MAVTYNFNSGGIPSDFINDADQAWDTASFDSGTRARSASPGDQGYSSLVLVGDFDAGDIDFDYYVDSEPGSDIMYFSVDGEAPHLTASGNSSFAAATTKTITAGVHVLIWTYIKDVNTATGTDRAYIDNLVVPDYTVVDMSNAEQFGTLPTTGWTNDPTPAEEWTLDTRGLYGNSAISASGQSSQNSDFEYNSDSGAPAGDVVVIYSYSSEAGFDFARLLIDAGQEFSDSGVYLTSGNTTPALGLHAYVGSVTSGAHEYIFRFFKDSGTEQGEDAMRLHAFLEPGMNPVGGANPHYAFGHPFKGPFSGPLG